MPAWLAILSWYALVSCVSFAWYWQDKVRARRGWRRTRERTLHLIDLLGGWPGGLAAQRVVRHKTRDRVFQIRFILIVMGHLAGWAIVLWIGLSSREA